jgi:hypothetical protein
VPAREEPLWHQLLSAAPEVHQRDPGRVFPVRDRREGVRQEVLQGWEHVL